jgi:hypothetical protein
MMWETSIPRLEGHLCAGGGLKDGVERGFYPVGAAACAGVWVLPRGKGAGGGTVPVAGRECGGEGLGGWGEGVGGRERKWEIGDLRLGIEVFGFST